MSEKKAESTTPPQELSEEQPVFRSRSSSFYQPPSRSPRYPSPGRPEAPRPVSLPTNRPDTPPPPKPPRQRDLTPTRTNPPTTCWTPVVRDTRPVEPVAGPAVEICITPVSGMSEFEHNRDFPAYKPDPKHQVETPYVPNNEDDPLAEKMLNETRAELIVEGPEGERRYSFNSVSTGTTVVTAIYKQPSFSIESEQNLSDSEDNDDRFSDASSNPGSWTSPPRSPSPEPRLNTSSGARSPEEQSEAEDN